MQNAPLISEHLARQVAATHRGEAEHRGLVCAARTHSQASASVAATRPRRLAALVRRLARPAWS